MASDRYFSCKEADWEEFTQRVYFQEEEQGAFASPGLQGIATKLSALGSARSNDLLQRLTAMPTCSWALLCPLFSNLKPQGGSDAQGTEQRK